METTIRVSRPVQRAGDTKATWLARLQKHLAEVDKMIERRDAFGWTDDDQRDEWSTYRGRLAADVDRLDQEEQMRRLSGGRRKGPG